LTDHFCDTSVWLALALEQHAHHARALAWFERSDANGSILLCRSTQQSFLRLLTNSAVLAPYGLSALTNREAWEVEGLRADDRIAFRANEPDGLDRVWQEFSDRPSASPKLWMDAYLAAFAFAAGMQFVTTDRAFHQFRGLDLLVLGEA
jgi:toxin-antitoxin system PIN domain toxin